MSAADLHCPGCGAELDLSTVFAAQADAKALERLIEVGYPLGTRVLLYIGLHKPNKQQLTARKKIKLLLEVLPDLERQAITRAGRDWPAPLAHWAQAMDQMQASATSGSLELPLRGHGYLYTKLQGMADRAEAAQERQAEQDKRTGHAGGAHLPTVSVRSQAAHVSNAVLQAMDKQIARATPMPADARDLLSRLRGGSNPQSTAGEES